MRLGEIQTLRIARFKEFGAYLEDQEKEEKAGREGSADAVLLPGKQLPPNAGVGDLLEVFLYKDSLGRPIATTRKPFLTVGTIGRLRIREVTKIGAFLDIGLERDVLLPFREREGELKPGAEVLVALYVDKSGRLAATMRIYPYLEKAEGITADEEVEGTVYGIRDTGVFVAVRNRYFGLIPKSEVYGPYRIGEEVRVRVMRVREDGKLDLSPRQKSYFQMGDDAALLLERLEQAGGSLPYGDRSEPDVIREAFGISKNAFKRAVGHLLKEGKISLTDGGIQRK